MSDCSHFPRARDDALMIERLGDELLVYDSRSHLAHALDRGAATVWQACDGRRDLDALCARCAIDRETLTATLTRLEELGLMQRADDGRDGETRRDALRKLTLAGAGMAAAPTISSILVPTVAQAASPTGMSVFSRPGVYTWRVPDGVTTAQFDLYGAEGAGSGSSPAYPGLGAHVRAVLAVTPGDSYTIYVGGQGSSGDHNSGTGGAGGYNGGGPGGSSYPTFGSAGGGGGASDVRNGPGLSARLLVAGGGGGTTTDSPSCGEGGAGGAVGQPGGDGCASNFPPAGGGPGGTGSGPGGDGGTGVGGPGYSNTGYGGVGGGGGGGGYYGGGGGDSGLAYPTLNRGTSSGGGGGGSSYITTLALCSSPIQSGVQGGDGSVTILYDPPPC